MNSQVYNFNVEKKKIFEQICKECFGFNDVYIAYNKVYHNQSFIYITNANNNFIREYCETIQNRGSFLTEAIKCTSNKQSPYIFLWPHADDNSILSLLNSYDIGNGISFLFRVHNAIETISLATNNNDHTFLTSILNQLNIIKLFVEKFRKKINMLIQENYDMDIMGKYNDAIDIEYDQNLYVTRKNGYRHHSMEKLYSFTFREKQCLELLSNGYTVKKIALILGISPRTIDHHISNIKLKTKTNTKNELVALYHNGVLEQESIR